MIEQNKTDLGVWGMKCCVFFNANALIIFLFFFSHILFSKNFHQFPGDVKFYNKGCILRFFIYLDMKKGFSFDPSLISESWRKQRNSVSIAISYTEKKQEEMR